ncbi:hypothetical protein THRCLA_09493 [Thraustotheca clavata]|uniref:Uncharacterized protein n=1 Tax=Thraustotheca clavata TaxID=74557 RepID=A0A1V9YW28_9STRA|nr:hypothetical protein THRCLA_09493 [Thraustotheca clavata]
MSVVVKQKAYLADKKAFTSHLQVQALAIQLVKSTVLQGVIVMNDYVQELNLEDEDLDDEPEKPAFIPPTPREFIIRCQKHCIKTISNTTMLRSLEFLSIQYLEVRSAGKLVKDVAKSALRKYARNQSSLTAAVQIVKTGAKSSILTSVAIFLVEEIIALINVLQQKIKRTSDQAEKQFLQVTLVGLRRCGLAIVASAAGGAVGTLIAPGRGTFIGAFVGESLAYAF